jgi:ABC-type multidrug transport system fused ATPase/permease subunit
VTILQFAKEILRVYPRQVFVITVLLLFATLLEMVGAALTIPLINLFLKDTSFNTGVVQTILKSLRLADVSVIVLMALLLAITIARATLMFLSQYAVARVGVNTEFQLKRSLLENMLLANWSFHTNQNAGLINNVITKETATSSQAIRHLGAYYSSILVTAILLTSSAFVAWDMLLLSMVFAVPMLAIARGLNVRTRQIAVKRIEANNAASAELIEISSLMKFLKASASERAALDRFARIARTFANLQLRNSVYDNIVTVLPELFAGIFVVFLVFFSAYVFQYPLGDFIFFAIIVNRSYARIGRVQTGRRMLISTIPSYEACMRLLRLAGREREIASSKNSALDRMVKDVRLEAVSFKYEEGHREVLTDVNVVIPCRSLVALVGQSGSGKTTIVDLILRLFVPSGGRILVDGVDIERLDFFAWRQRVAYVPQDPILFRGSLRDNILRDTPPATDKALRDACDLAHVSEFVEALPDGLDTEVGDRGVKLSGGQRQRIAIARALMRQADLLILDEATSALDAHTESIIRETLMAIKAKMTVIVIAHRFTIIHGADLIYVLKDGRIVENGDFKQLSEANGEFSRLLTQGSLIEA